MSFAIYHNFVINASHKKVFNAISQPNHLNNWWTLKSSGEPKLDAVYNLNFTDKYNWYCMVSKLEPNISMHFKMTKADADWNPTTFGFDLEIRNNQTLVRFSHINWPYQNDHFKHSSFSWALLLKGLKDYIEGGIVVPFEKRS
ncbi:SRPBCC domain-containing protein [Snuella lapsa]|uniref:Activator of Hsp90 ATPase homologue 1/2-like C-terminal domain-containing protein n=1 Tax=Snuella lapsa TaxID=870481 RepID=A0ABP6Y8I4_9FLAO